jgi:putative phosphotransacetylase
MKKHLPLARSDIHVHLTAGHVEELFGPGHRLTLERELTIPGQFAALERVTVQGPEGSIRDVIPVGPERAATQVEISRSNGLALGIVPPVRLSGDIEGTPGCVLVGPEGAVVLERGVIAAARHIHMHPRDAAEFGVGDGDRVRIRVAGERGVVFENVTVKVSPDFALEMHIDFDEGFAAGVEDFQLVELLR